MGCDEPDQLLFSREKTIYRYTAYDSSHSKVARGWLFLKFKDDMIKGEWEIEAVGSPQNIGPQTGNGNLKGGYGIDSIWVELQPQMCDNNLLLKGYLTDDGYSGRWIYVGFMGIINTGTFTVRKKYW